MKPVVIKSGTTCTGFVKLLLILVYAFDRGLSNSIDKLKVKGRVERVIKILYASLYDRRWEMSSE